MSANTDGEFLVRTGGPHDLAAIAALAQGLDPQTGTQQPSGGFLVMGYTEEHYRERLAEGARFWVVDDSDGTVAFLYVEELGSSDHEVAELAERAGVEDALVVKQLGVAVTHQRHGVGALLYNELVMRFPDRDILAAVVTDPPNTASLAFHQRMGFTPIARFYRGDGRPRLLLRRVPGQRSK